MERALAEAKRQASEDALTVINQQEDSSEVSTTHRHTYIQKHTHIHTKTCTPTNTKTQRHTHTHRDKDTHIFSKYQTSTQTNIPKYKTTFAQTYNNAGSNTKPLSPDWGVLRGSILAAGSHVFTKALPLSPHCPSRAAGTVGARPARRVAAVTPRATAAPSASTRTGRSTTTCVARACRASREAALSRWAPPPPPPPQPTPERPPPTVRAPPRAPSLWWVRAPCRPSPSAPKRAAPAAPRDPRPPRPPHCSTPPHADTELRALPLTSPDLDHHPC